MLNPLKITKFNPLKVLPAGVFTKQDKAQFKVASGALRVPTGLYILNAGLGKFGVDEEGAKGLRDMATGGIPAAKEFDPETFVKALATGETALGAMLLMPFISNRFAGLSLAAFGAGLLSMYFGEDEYTEADGIRPSDAGKSLAKDAWLVGTGVALAALPQK